MLKRIVRVLLVSLLAIGVSAQSFAAANGSCGAGPVGGAQTAAAVDSGSPEYPGHDGGEHTNLAADAHCALGAALPSSMAPFTPTPPSGGVAPAMVLAPSAFVPDRLDRPPLLTFHA